MTAEEKDACEQLTSLGHTPEADVLKHACSERDKARLDARFWHLLAVTDLAIVRGAAVSLEMLVQNHERITAYIETATGPEGP